MTLNIIITNAVIIKASPDLGVTALPTNVQFTIIKVNDSYHFTAQNWVRQPLQKQLFLNKLHTPPK